MSASTDLRVLLAGAAGVTALVGTRIGQDRAEQDWVRPFIVFGVVETDPQRALDGSVHGTRYVFEVQCWANTRASADAVADAVQTACDGDHRYVTARSGGYEPDLDLESAVLIVDWWT